jgi:hypothetical protein
MEILTFSIYMIYLNIFLRQWNTISENHTVLEHSLRLNNGKKEKKELTVVLWYHVLA